MTDAFDAKGEALPSQSFDESFSEPAEMLAVNPADTEAAPAVPNGFVKLGLAAELLRAVEDLGYTQPTLVQEKVIPLALPSDDSAGQGAASYTDLMVSSQTGSGKTAAFLLPVLHTLLTQQAQAEARERADFDRAVAEAAAKGEPAPKRPKRKDPTNARNFKAATPGALILCPTRELAQQVAHDAIGLVQHCRGLRIASVVGGMPYQLQIAKLQNANLVVATPGRLLDLQRSMQIKLDQVQFLVVDEADRMLDLGFSDDLAEINQLTIERRQTMMFSATFAPRIQQLAARVMRQPQKVQIDSPQEKHVNIKQVLFWADNAQHKRKLLDHWLRDASINQAIVFASTQVECDGLANDLQQDGFSAVALHGALSQGLRNRRLMALRNGQVQILVATDVAARGIDVPTITHVFNFGLPMKAEDYTHRIGRTGRAGRDGIAVTFAEFRDRRKIFDIEGYSHQQFKAEVVPGLEPQQRFSDARPPRGNFGGHRDGQSRDRKFGGGNRGGFGGGFGGGFNDRNARGPRQVGAGSYQNNSGGDFAARDDRGGERREGFSYERKGGFNDRFAGAPRNEGFAPRGDFAGRGGKPAFGKPAFSKPAKPGGGGKVFVPRDAKKRVARSDR
ncbi:DEAD/DEAH box helicase [Variovorax terrae]|uniref:DEAD/DEAH box helicase n=1 Tax=Variovorax terrae TaxID=2923278 RepID=A0A9X1VXU2_9BURK|nr:DEAD/DEAH box helicase [Variovorax terrae]MCJ0764174.1 DEAD/DEAH box helicase [Variovorax terrae]